jgi:hypothetical protein
MSAANPRSAQLLLLAALLLTGIISAGCAGGGSAGGGGSVAETTRSGEAGALGPPDLRPLPPLREVQVEEARLSVPSVWTVSANPQEPGAEFLASLERVRADDPAALGQIDESLGRESPQLLVAFDPLLEGMKYMTRVRLGVVPREPGFEGEFEEWSERWRELIASTPTLFGPLESERVELPPGEAFRITYRYRSYEDVPLVGDDYYLVRGDRAYVLAFEGGDEGLLPLFRAIAATFELTP